VAVGLFFFDRTELLSLARSRREEFASAEPFPHVVFDGIVPDEVLVRVLSEFPDSSDQRWFRFDHSKSHKLAMNEDWLAGPNTRQLLAQFNSLAFIDFLEALTGVNDLIPDPHFSGGGLHQIETGGFLKIHTDFNVHPVLELDRRINVIIYLNRNWEPDWGGQLELWNVEMTEHLKIEPLFNRMIVFDTSDTSKHGHPDPLASPQGVSRRSLAFYYYTHGGPEEEPAVAHQTKHFQRPGEVFEEATARKTHKPQKRSPVKVLAANLVPPVVVRRAARLQSRIKPPKSDPR
jgi:hypothetical protein